MGELVPGTDGLAAEEVGPWVEEKLAIARTYAEITHSTRKKFLPPNLGGAAYIDLFCGPGLAKIRNTNQFVDGTAVAIWKVSVKKGSPFTKVFIADKDDDRRRLCGERLRRIGAPVVEIKGDALSASAAVVAQAPPHGFHIALLDPYSLGALDFRILSALSGLKRIDILTHLSAMDMTRNIDSEAAEERNEFDAFAPGWREGIPTDLPLVELRNKLLQFWERKVETELRFRPTAGSYAVVNSVNTTLYWLRLLTRHALAEKFWKAVLRAMPKATLDMFP